MNNQPNPNLIQTNHTPPEPGDPDYGYQRYKYTRRMIWVLQTSAILLCVYAIQNMGPAAAPVLTTTLPAMLGLAGAYAGITNKWGR